MEFLFSALRGDLRRIGIDMVYFAKLMNIGSCALSMKFNGRSEWTIQEMYRAMDIINRPYDELYIIFPKDGKQMSNEMQRLKSLERNEL